MSAMFGTAGHTRALVIAALCIAAFLPSSARAQGFKFEKDPGAQQQAAEAMARGSRVAENLSTPCKDAIKNKKIAVIIAEEQSNGVVLARQENYGPHFQLINVRLQALGLRTYTPEEIRKQIAQAEIDAYFKNNPDAALSAAKRLGANFVLRGLIVSQATYNSIVRVNQVTVGMGVTRAAADGRTVAKAGANAASYAGPDVRAMALTLLNENADEVVSRLYSEYCRNAETITKGGVQSAKSIHVAFTTDESCFRFVFRIDGAPTWQSALTPAHGSNTVSPFVCLVSAST